MRGFLIAFAIAFIGTGYWGYTDGRAVVHGGDAIRLRAFEDVRLVSEDTAPSADGKPAHGARRVLLRLYAESLPLLDYDPDLGSIVHKYAACATHFPDFEAPGFPLERVATVTTIVAADVTLMKMIPQGKGNTAGAVAGGILGALSGYAVGYSIGLKDLPSPKSPEVLRAQVAPTEWEAYCHWRIRDAIRTAALCGDLVSSSEAKAYKEKVENLATLEANDLIPLTGRLVLADDLLKTARSASTRGLEELSESLQPKWMRVVMYVMFGLAMLIPCAVGGAAAWRALRRRRGRAGRFVLEPESSGVPSQEQCP